MPHPVCSTFLSLDLFETNNNFAARFNSVLRLQIEIKGLQLAFLNHQLRHSKNKGAVRYIKTQFKMYLIKNK
jgi:hypothetical protein